MTINGEQIESFGVIGIEQGNIKDEFKTLDDCYNFIKRLKISDKREGIEDIYLITIETRNSFYGNYKLIKRNNKYSLKLYQN